MTRNFVLALTLVCLTPLMTSCSGNPTKPEATVVVQKEPVLIRVPDAHLLERAPTPPEKGATQQQVDEYTRQCRIAIERSDQDKKDIKDWEDKTEQDLKKKPADPPKNEKPP